MESTVNDEETRERVRKRYANEAKSRGGCDCNCGPKETSVADLPSARIGYTEDQLGSIPADADLGLGCGNPTALAGIQPGETVVDLGSGGGIDCFLAAKVVGPTGKVIGVDMTDEMLDLARRNARKGGFTNVEFRKGLIEDLPVDDSSADLVISNCVINLSTDKPAVFREIHRVLKPGGRMSISDIVTSEKLPEDLRGSVAAYVGCIAGALTRDDYLAGIRDAGFSDVSVVSDMSYGSLIAGDDEAVQNAAAQLGVGTDTIRRWAPAVRSIKVTARK